MTMKAVAMKHLCLVMSLLSAMNGKAIGQGYETESPDMIYLVCGADGQCVQSDIQPAGPSPSQDVPCQEGFVRLESGKCYFFSFSKMNTWQEALAVCQGLGATLAHPTSVLENTVLANYLKSNFKGSPLWYLGGNDLATKDQWVWADKTPIVYKDWIVNRPAGAGRCLQYQTATYQWNNINCNAKRKFVCQQL